MKRYDEEDLLKELLAGEDLSEFRRRSLDHGLDALRRTRRRRQVLRGGAVAVLPLLLAAALWLSRTPPDTSLHLAIAPTPPKQTQALSPARSSAGIKRISDEELLALFPGRSVA